MNSGNLASVPRTSKKVAAILRRKAQAGATFWTMNSVIRTGYNASHVQVLEGKSATGHLAAVVYANGHYAKWREIGSSRAGPRAPEWVLRKSLPVIKVS